MRYFLAIALLLLLTALAQAGTAACSAGSPVIHDGSSLGCVTSGTVSMPGIIISGGSAPTIAAGAGAGTSPTISITGALNSQVISLTTGTLPSASAVIATVTLPTSCPTTVVASLTPGNINVAQLSASGSVYVASSATNTYTLNSSSTGLFGATVYKWNVHVDCW
jgi:hypothetical protein